MQSGKVSKPTINSLAPANAPSLTQLKTSEPIALGKSASKGPEKRQPHQSDSFGEKIESRDLKSSFVVRPPPRPMTALDEARYRRAEELLLTYRNKPVSEAIYREATEFIRRR